MQDDNDTNNQEQTETTTIELKETDAVSAKHRLPMRKLLLWGGLVLVLVVLLGVVFVMRNTKQAANNNKNDAAIGTAEEIKTYSDCLKAPDTLAQESGGTCTTSDGAVFDETDQKNVGDQSADTSSRSAGNQSVRLLIGEDPGTTYDDVTTLTNSGSTMTLQVRVVTENIELGKCSMTIKTTPDKPGVSPTQRTFTPLASQDVTFIDGKHTVNVRCPDASGKYLSVEKTIGVGDRLPEQCATYSYESPIKSSAATIADLRSAMNGTWAGCADTPWWPSYYVTVNFKQDGTYNAYSTEEIDGHVSEGGFYVYNTAGSNGAKKFDVTVLNSGLGGGYLDVIRPETGNAQRGELRNIKLDGNLLTFDFHLTSSSKPIHFVLKRQ